ncbi:MAG: ATP-binding protein [Candidatus Woesearchaeota archaeon]|jgi:hypothetical protein|nr:ATP-binding protein [Candidatus Woesearchaeota archaeon]
MDTTLLFDETINCLKKINNKKDNIDLSQSSFLTPFFIAPLAAYLNNVKSKNCILPIRTEVFSYLEYVKFPTGINVDEFKRRADKKTYLPLFSFYDNEIDNEEILSKLIDCLTIFADIKYNKDLIYNPLAELIDNVKEHSHSTKCVITAQIYEEKYLAISLVDNGKTIPQNYIDAKFGINNDIEAFEQILKGISSTGDNTRGFGIQTSLQVISEALKGTIFIVSGGGGIYKQGKNPPTLYDFTKYNLKYKGTIINIIFEMPKESLKINKMDYLSKKRIY